jgi:hypothetical protein
VVIPFGLNWQVTITNARRFFNFSDPALEGFPEESGSEAGKRFVWPGLILDFDADEKLAGIEYQWTILTTAVKNTYQSLCHVRYALAAAFPPASLVTRPLQATWVRYHQQLRQTQEQILQQRQQTASRPAPEGYRAAPPAPPVVRKADSLQLTSPNGGPPDEKPVYILAMIELKEAGRPLKYAEISARLSAKGYRFGPDSVMGSLSGFYSTARGKSLLNRVGKGEYELRHDGAGQAALRAELETQAAKAKVRGKKKVLFFCCFFYFWFVQTVAAAAAAAAAAASAAGFSSSSSSSSAAVASNAVGSVDESSSPSVSRQMRSFVGETSPYALPPVPAKFKAIEVIEEEKRKPYLYETAYEVLRQDGSSMYYKEVAARINALGIATTGDQVLGALGGWYAHAGAEYLERTGPGRFRARPGKVFVPSTGTREITAVMIVRPPTVPVTTNANGEPEPMVQIGQAFFSRAFLHQISVSKAPFYQLACEILREALVPMHYREIAAVLKASGRNVHQDTIMGSLNGFINTAVGKAQLQRVGKGIYTLCDFVRVDQRTTSIMPPPPLQPAPRSTLASAGPLPPPVVMLPSGSKRGRESDEEDDVVADLHFMESEHQPNKRASAGGAVSVPSLSSVAGMGAPSDVDQDNEEGMEIDQPVEGMEDDADYVGFEGNALFDDEADDVQAPKLAKVGDGIEAKKKKRKEEEEEKKNERKKEGRRKRKSENNEKKKDSNFFDFSSRMSLRFQRFWRCIICSRAKWEDICLG